MCEEEKVIGADGREDKVEEDACGSIRTSRCAVSVVRRAEICKDIKVRDVNERCEDRKDGITSREQGNSAVSIQERPTGQNFPSGKKRGSGARRTPHRTFPALVFHLSPSSPEKRKYKQKRRTDSPPCQPFPSTVDSSSKPHQLALPSLFSFVLVPHLPKHYHGSLLLSVLLVSRPGDPPRALSSRVARSLPLSVRWIGMSLVGDTMMNCNRRLFLPTSSKRCVPVMAR